MRVLPLSVVPSSTAPRAVDRSAAAQSESVGTSQGQPPADELELSSEAQQLLEELTPEQQAQVQELAARDREVRSHEQAHLAAAGPYARGGPTYTYQKGPDGQNYAIGGEVQIDTAPVKGDPEATVRKAQIVRAAALAPAEPSSQDRAVAAAASQMEQQALAELRQQNAGSRSPLPEQTDSREDSSYTTADSDQDRSALDLLV